MLKAVYTKYVLHFKTPVGTSRGIISDKETWFIKIWDDMDASVFGLGECALFRGLSHDDQPEYELMLKKVCQKIHNDEWLRKELVEWPSICFGVETALKDLKNGGKRILFPSSFTNGKTGIPINGLIWMGPIDFIKQQVKEKLLAGFRCLKFKVGATDLQSEMEIIRAIREEFGHRELEIRLDANGAFSYPKVFKTLDQLSKFDIHSIEQPIWPGQINELSEICKNTPIPIALDEELIGKITLDGKRDLLSTTLPQYIIIKPALSGGFTNSQDWINEANKLKIGWWITSALESNIGLNAIAQWTYSLNTTNKQGLGTGNLYKNNIHSPLYTKGQELFINPEVEWDKTALNYYE